jgi:BMFP domain-containing protein YqiC
MCKPEDFVAPQIRRAADDARQQVRSALARLTAKLDAANKEDNDPQGTISLCHRPGARAA